MMLEACQENENSFIQQKWNYYSPEPQIVIIQSKSFPPFSYKLFSLPKTDNCAMDRRK